MKLVYKLERKLRLTYSRLFSSSQLISMVTSVNFKCESIKKRHLSFRKKKTMVLFSDIWCSKRTLCTGSSLDSKPPKKDSSFYSKLSNRWGSLMRAYIKNEKKQQEKTIALFAVVIVFIWLLAFPVEVAFVSFFLLSFLYFLFRVGRKFLIWFFALKNSNTIISIIFFVYISILFTLEYYLNIIIYFIVISFFFFRKWYMGRDPQKTSSTLLQYFKDEDSIEYHWQKEFPLFRELRDFLFFVFFFLVLEKFYSYKYKWLFGTSVIEFFGYSFETPLVLYIHAVALIKVVPICFLFVWLSIQWIIIDYCNMKILLTPLTKTMSLLGVGGGLYFTYLGGRSEFVNPANIPGDHFLTHSIQRLELGYAAHAPEDLTLASEFRYKFPGEKVPLTEDGFINGALCKERVLSNPAKILDSDFFDRSNGIFDPKDLPTARLLEELRSRGYDVSVSQKPDFSESSFAPESKSLESKDIKEYRP